MSVTSNWPLPKSSVRFLVPKPMIKQLQLSSLSRGLIPLAFGYYENASGHNIKRSDHDDHLLLFCISGTGKIKANGQTFNLNPNQMVFLPKGTAHEYQADIKSPWSIFWAHVDGHMFAEFMDIIGIKESNLVLTLTEPQPVIDEFKQLINSRSLGYQLNRFFVASNMLKKILSLVTLQRPVISMSINRNLSSYSINAYLEDNLSEMLSLDDMCEHFGLSKFHFAKKFQQLMGNSPLKYFMELKVQQACKLLDSSDIAIKVIAKTLGYEDPYYFSRLFKSIIGISPKQYRQSRHGH